MTNIMRVRGYSPGTIGAYLNQVRDMAEYFNKAPHTLTPEHIHRYQVFLVREKQVSWSFFNQAVCAIRFFLIMWLVTAGLSNTYRSVKSTAGFRSFYQKQKYLLCCL